MSAGVERRVRELNMNMGRANDNVATCPRAVGMAFDGSYILAFSLCMDSKFIFSTTCTVHNQTLLVIS